MKYLVLVVTMLFVVGCSSTPSKLERIEANEAAIADLQRVIANQEMRVLDIESTPKDTNCPAACVIQIDRAFEKSQYK